MYLFYNMLWRCLFDVPVVQVCVFEIFVVKVRVSRNCCEGVYLAVPLYRCEFDVPVVQVCI